MQLQDTPLIDRSLRERFTVALITHNRPAFQIGRAHV